MAVVLDGYLNGTWGPVIGALAVWAVVYYTVVAIYRLYLSPIAHFPGPKLAGLTRWYEAYYEIVKSGAYSRRIDRMHDEYGPIVRVAPDELHIRDSDFFDDVYAKNLRVAKIGWTSRFGSPASTFTTPDPTKHRRRRAGFSSMFSRQAILQLEPVIRDSTVILSQRLEEFAESKRVLNVREAYPAYTGDIIMQYSFGFCYHQLETPNFDSFHHAFEAIGGMGHIAAQWPWVLPLLNALPDALVEKMEPHFAMLLRLKRDQWDLVGRTIRGEELGDKVSHRTIFHEMVESRMPPEDKTQKRLADEAQTTVGAGVETTANAMCIATFHIANTPRIYEKLHQELVAAFPDRTVLPGLMKFEKLPYLRACILEALRLGYGLSARNPRSHDRPLRYQDWVIPENTIVGMTIVDVHHDENIFPDSHSYIPERWLGNPIASTGKPLEHYMVSFGRGPRMCMGINLAWAELYYSLGTVFRRYKFRLFETDVTDVQLAHDFFIPAVKKDSKGVRLIVSKTHD